jgi:hypothetical protein
MAAATKATIKKIQDNQAKAGKASGRQRKGAIVYWWLTGVMASISSVKELYEQYDLSWEDWGPPDQRATAAFRKTINEVGRSLNKKGNDSAYMIRLIDESADHLLYGVVKEDKLREAEDLAHACEAKVKLKRESEKVVTSKDNGTVGYEIAKRVQELFDTMYCHMVVQDWSRLLTANLKKMGGVSIRPTGTIYYAPERYRDILTKLRLILDDIPGDSHLCCIDLWGDQPDVARDAKKALESELADLQEEIQKFKEKAPQERTLKSRLDEFKALKERGMMFAEVLGFQAESLVSGLDQCSKLVEAFLSGGHFKGAEDKDKRAAVKGPKQIVAVEKKETVVRRVRGKTVEVEVPVKVKPKKKAASRKRRMVGVA